MGREVSKLTGPDIIFIRNEGSLILWMNTKFVRMGSDIAVRAGKKHSLGREVSLL